MSLKKTRFSKVVDFNKSILGVKRGIIIQLQTDDENRLSVTQLKEEAEELSEAHANRDIVGVIDAVLDSVYFSYGILYKLGLDEELVDTLFAAIHHANMTKKKGVKANRPGFDSADATKPAGWVAPETVMTDILDSYMSKEK